MLIERNVVFFCLQLSSLNRSILVKQYHHLTWSSLPFSHLKSEQSRIQNALHGLPLDSLFEQKSALPKLYDCGGWLPREEVTEAQNAVEELKASYMKNPKPYREHFITSQIGTAENADSSITSAFETYLRLYSDALTLDQDIYLIVD